MLRASAYVGKLRHLGTTKPQISARLSAFPNRSIIAAIAQSWTPVLDASYQLSVSEKFVTSVSSKITLQQLATAVHGEKGQLTAAVVGGESIKGDQLKDISLAECAGKPLTLRLEDITVEFNKGQSLEFASAGTQRVLALSYVYLGAGAIAVGAGLWKFFS